MGAEDLQANGRGVCFAVFLATASPGWGFAEEAASCTLYAEGPRASVTIVNNEGVDKWVPDDPNGQAILEFPKRALTSPFPFGVPLKDFQTAISFSLYADSGRIFPFQHRYTKEGRPIAPKNLAPRLRILVHDRFGLEHVLKIVNGSSWDELNVPLPSNSYSPAHLSGLYRMHRQIGSAFKKDAFFSRDERGNVTDVIECSVLGSVPFPQCTHMMSLKSVDLDISYRRDMLDHWQHHRKLAADFMACIYRQNR